MNIQEGKKSKAERLNELYGLIAKQGLILYGAGYHAGIWVQLLKNADLLAQLQYFVVSEKPDRPVFEGKQVYAYSEAPFRKMKDDAGKLPVLGIAMHEAAADSLDPDPGKDYPGKCIPLYPLLNEAAFGTPSRRDGLRLEEILGAQPEDNFWITLRYAALCEEMSGREENRHTERYGILCRKYKPEHTAAELYLMIQNSFSREDTARRRLERFYELAHRIDRKDILMKEPVLLDSGMRVIDGLHRIALALYLDRESIPCEIVPARDIYEQLFTEKNRAVRNVQHASGFGAGDMAFLQGMREEICNELAEL